jgi:hypothetical protein
VISEHHFANNYTSAWHTITPLSDGYWHVENKLVSRIAPPLSARSPKLQRAVINEAAFLAFCSLYDKPRPLVRQCVLQAVEKNLGAAQAYVKRFISNEIETENTFDEACLKEAGNLVLRLLHFFSVPSLVNIKPKFPGCGLLSECEGDVILGKCLYEIKAGDRPFRVADLRQLLIYSALAYAGRTMTFNSIGLFNPRTGVAWVRSLDQVCLAISGTRANDMLPALVEQFSMASVSR